MLINFQRTRLAHKHGHDHFYKKLLHLILTSKEVWVDSRDLEVSFNAVHKYYDVSLFRCMQSYGCGNKLLRDKTWNQWKETVVALFQLDGYSDTHRWVEAHPLRYIEPQDTKCIEGIRFQIPEDLHISL